MVKGLIFRSDAQPSKQSRLLLLLLATLALTWLLPAAASAESTVAIGDDELCKYHWTIGDAWLPYCRTERLGETREHVERAIVVIHGKNRNAKSYFDLTERLAGQEGLGRETQIIALQFLTPADIKALGLPAQYLTWTRDGWKHGFKSTNGPQISSFEVLDKLLSRLIVQNPKLKRITIAGHSAGAQFAQRHALGRKLDTSAFQGELHYVVANAGSYMYLTPDRAGPVAGCKKTYNHYRYGYEDNALDYFGGTSPDSLWKNLASARVTVLLGKSDTETADTDRSCPARAQGPNRLERGRNFHRLTLKHLPAHFAASDFARFQLQIVSGVGHDFERMWDSRCGRALIFGRGICVATPPPKAAFPL